jgi:ketosteroid isomerase-like protein
MSFCDGWARATTRAWPPSSRARWTGHDAVVLGTIRNVMRRTGEAYRAYVALHLTVEDGMIRRYHIYEDSLSVARAWHGDAAVRRGSA